MAFIPPSKYQLLLRSIPHHNYQTYYSDDHTYLSCLYAQTNTISFDEIKTKDIEELPVYNILDNVRHSLELKNNLLLEASPGAGKTTVVPLLVSSLESNSSSNDKVLVVEPRRMATRNAAQRMSTLINQSVGESVGYAIRGESKQSSQTSVLVCTDGVLLNMLQKDPELLGYHTIILDEYHERGLGVDTCLALLREIQLNYRPDLKIVVMSATLLGSTYSNDEENEEETTGKKLSRLLGGNNFCTILHSEGRQYPISIQYSSRSSPRHGALFRDTKLLVETMANAIEDGLLKAPNKGDILAFLPGAKEIRRVVQELNDRGLKDVVVYPLYGAQPKSDQDKAIYNVTSTPHQRRIIVSSPIAEASLTIEGVTCVVDSGLQREPRYDSNTGLPQLVTVACSRDSAIQRAGRGGRLMEGYCIRLYSETEFDKLEQHSKPEITSTDLVSTTLLLTEWGCTSYDDIEELPFLDLPPKDSLTKAYQMLVDLNALEEYRLANDRRKRYKLTSHGQSISTLSTHPRFATSIVKALDNEISLVAAVTASALIDQDLLIRGRESNLALNVRDILKEGPRSYNGKQLLNFASRISKEAMSAVTKALSGEIQPSKVSECVGEALQPGFIDLVAQRRGDASYGGSSYMLSLGQSARLDGKQDEGEYILVVSTSTGDDQKIRIRQYCKIDLKSLLNVAIEKEEVYTVASKGYIVRKRRVTKVGSLVLSSTPLPSPTSDEVIEVLLDAIDSIGEVSSLLSMQPKKNLAEIVELRSRIQLAQQCSSDDAWPPCFASLDSTESGKGTMDDEQILINMLEPWLGAATSLKSIDMLSILKSQLSPDQQNQLDSYYPTTITAPDGSSIPISYNTETSPIASAKLQQFFGQLESQVVGPPSNTLPISLSLLSPAGKPLAQTTDLPFFWTEVYSSIRTEMRGKYPKHPWPEDPTTAVATRKTKKQQATTSPSSEGEGRVDKRKEKSKKRKKKMR